MRRLETNLDRVPNSDPLPPRRDEALRRLNLTPEQLRSAPPINEILKGIPSGLTIALKAMRFSQQELIIQFLDKYDSISERDREGLTFEEIAISAQVDPRHLLGEIMLAMREDSVNTVKLIAVAAHPEIMRKRVEFAQQPGGFRDRDALDTMLGALPSTKGATFIGKQYFGTATPEPDNPEGPVAPIVAAEELVSDVDYIFPDCEVMQEKVQGMRQKLLEAKK